MAETHPVVVYPDCYKITLFEAWKQKHGYEKGIESFFLEAFDDFFIKRDMDLLYNEKIKRHRPLIMESDEPIDEPILETPSRLGGNTSILDGPDFDTLMTEWDVLYKKHVLDKKDD